MSSFWDDWFKRFRERRGLFFPEIDRMIEEMEREMAETFRDMESRMPSDMVRVRRLPDGSVRREYGPFVYGYSVKIGPDGKPVVREFGNIKPGIPGEGRPPLNLQEQREPLVDIIEEDGYVLRAKYDGQRTLFSWHRMAALAVAVSLQHVARRVDGASPMSRRPVELEGSDHTTSERTA